MKNSKLLLKQIEQVKNPNYVPPPRPRLITNNLNGWHDAIANPPKKTDGYLVKYGCVGACLSVGTLVYDASTQKWNGIYANETVYYWLPIPPSPDYTWAEVEEAH